MPDAKTKKDDDASGTALVMQESAEMYLETILVLSNEGDRVRAVDIATRMGHSRPTVSEWMKKLEANGYIVVGDDHRIELTERGCDIAQHVYERHVMLTQLFESVGVDPRTAAADACRVEHYISDETFRCLRDHCQTQEEGRAVR